MAELRTVPSTAQICAGHTWIPNGSQGEMLHSGTKENGNRTPCPPHWWNNPRTKEQRIPRAMAWTQGGPRTPCPILELAATFESSLSCDGEFYCKQPNPMDCEVELSSALVLWYPAKMGRLWGQGSALKPTAPFLLLIALGQSLLHVQPEGQGGVGEGLGTA